MDSFLPTDQVSTETGQVQSSNPRLLRKLWHTRLDQTCPNVLESRKGARGLGRKARRRGGKAKKRGLSREQVPVLMAADRSGTTVSAVLPRVDAAALAAALDPVVAKDALLVSDGGASYPPCAAALGVSHEALNRSMGERVRGDLHVQTVNSRHSRLKDFLRPRRGIATRYLDNYLSWFHLVGLAPGANDRAGSVASLAKGRCVIRGLPVHLMILRWPDGPVAMPWPRSGRTVRDRRRARRSGPRRRCRPGGRTSRPGPCAARASPRSP